MILAQRAPVRGAIGLNSKIQSPLGRTGLVVGIPAGMRGYSEWFFEPFCTMPIINQQILTLRELPWIAANYFRNSVNSLTKECGMDFGTNQGWMMGADNVGICDLSGIDRV